MHLKSSEHIYDFNLLLLSYNNLSPIFNGYFRLLHVADYLDEHLTVRKRPRQLEELLVEDSEPGKPKAGTKRSRSYYPVQMSDHFSTVHVQWQECFLYR